jgi:hypothetical protein
MAAGIYRKRRLNLDLTGLLSSIADAALAIDLGRKGFAIRGKAEEGRIFYETGIAAAMTAFKEAQATADPQTILLAEYTFITQELEFCERTDKAAISSLSRAIRFFDDAFLALKIVEDSTLYQGAEQTYPHDAKYRIKGYPLDSFHIAIEGHKGRLQNILKTPGLDPIEKALHKQRLDTLKAGQEGYTELQRKALTK